MRLWRSVKYEEVDLKGHQTVPELMQGLLRYFEFYHAKRPHQSLDYRTPDWVYRTAQGGGARIEDQFTEPTAGKTGQQRVAAEEEILS
jgi:putative transposase